MLSFQLETRQTTRSTGGPVLEAFRKAGLLKAFQVGQAVSLITGEM